MSLTESQNQSLGTEAPDFSLPNVDGSEVSLEDFQEYKALVVIFMCNHCPYVKAVKNRINQLAKDYQPQGVGVVGINSNDAAQFPEDNFEAMKALAEEEGFEFPYLFDETQVVARAYGAVCTPDPFVYENENGDFILRYHGRIDDSWKDENKVRQRDLAEALDCILNEEPVPERQHPSMGCSIKWKAH